MFFLKQTFIFILNDGRADGGFFDIIKAKFFHSFAQSLNSDAVPRVSLSSG